MYKLPHPHHQPPPLPPLDKDRHSLIGSIVKHNGDTYTGPRQRLFDGSLIAWIILTLAIVTLFEIVMMVAM